MLYDRMDVEDWAVFTWLRAHQLHRNALHRLSMGIERLPPGWRKRALPFLALKDADAFLRRVSRDHIAMQGLRRVRQQVDPRRGAGTDQEIVDRLAPLLLSGAIWAIEIRAPKSRFVGKTRSEGVRRL